MKKRYNRFVEEFLELNDDLLRFAYKLTSNKEDAKDLLQETAFKVLTNSDKYTFNDNFRGWVFTIMRNLFINNVNKESRYCSLLENETYILNIPEESGLGIPDKSYAIKEINNALESLSAKDSNPLLMFVSGRKYEEISSLINIPEGTVKSRIHNAREKLQIILKDYRNDL